MKYLKHSLIAMLGISLLALTACSEKPTPEAEPKETTAAPATEPKAEDEVVSAEEIAAALSAPEAGSSAYPLTVCVVSGEDLFSMGEPVTIVHEGTTVKFCCDSCVDDFKDDPAKYLAKLEEAKKKKPQD